MATILIRNIPQTTLRQAKRLAQKQHHSLQEELRGILMDVLEIREGDWAARARRIYAKSARSGKSHSNSTDLLREDRSR